MARKYKLLSYLVAWLLGTAMMTSKAGAVYPSNPDPMPEAVKVLQYISDLPKRSGNRVLSAQHLWHGLSGVSTGYNNYVVSLYNQTGKWVAMIGVDYGVRSTPDQIKSANQTLIDFWKSGGLITIDYHVYNPWTGGDYQDMTSVDLRQLSDPNSAIYPTWKAEMDKIAGGFAELRDNGVVVIWRPFHEMNYRNHFWWDAGTMTSPYQPYKDMWRHMYDYFANHPVYGNINNLLWTYAPGDAYTYPSDVKVDEMYPGSQYVDIVGIDNYSDYATLVTDENYTRMLALGKPYAFTELGPATTDGSYDNMTSINAIRDRYPKTTYIQYWHDQWAIINQENALSYMNDPWIVTRDEVDWKGVVVPPTPLRIGRRAQVLCMTR